MGKKMQVVVMGLGYIGLPTAALIASKNISVIGVDIRTDVVDTINRGEIHIVEPDLDGLVKNVVDRKLFKAKAKPEQADVFLIAVPTPFKDNHNPDISFVESAVGMIIPFLKKGDLVILESTSPVGTTEKIKEMIYEKKPYLLENEKDSIFIAYCPERVLPGKIIFELEHNDRVIGGINHHSTVKAIEFYSLFVKGNLHITNSKTAEMCKLVENSYRDVNIAFANELSIICDDFDVNVWELIEMANKHPRVNILKPGCGVGGHCISVDPWFLVSQFPKKTKIIYSSRQINDYKPVWVIEKIKNKVVEWKNKYNKEPVIACMGLSFKSDIDDLRESPALYIVQELTKEFGKVIACEPNIDVDCENFKLNIDSRIFELQSYRDILEFGDIFVYLVGHKEFRKKPNGVYLDFCGVFKNE